ncbi:hypothetical protein [Nocardiopsis sp. JB363]|uniref:hypothetical protein n=1 Tax=Nocardiopsis sp. JB363 TaxID=1434837 RepID=UPI0013595A94|nr:hypothetical protein [Nocardiopsis sp. JB363]
MDVLFVIVIAVVSTTATGIGMELRVKGVFRFWYAQKVQELQELRERSHCFGRGFCSY